MASLNKVMLIGNLTHDPDVRYTPKGTAITEIRLAINRNYTTEAGEKREEVTYVDVSLFGRQGEIAAEYAPRQSSRPPQQRPPSQRPSAPPRPPADPDLDVEGDDIPF